MRSPIRVLVLLGLLAVVALAAIVLRGAFEMPLRARDAGPARPAQEGAGAQIEGELDPGEDVVARALRLAGIDSTKKKEWVDDIPDLELASLSPAARETFLRIANARRCGCGCGFTLAGCRRFDSECETSGPRAQALFDSVRAGRVASAEGFPERPKRR